MKKAKKVLILSQTNIIGGAEIVLCDYIKDNEVFDIFIFTNNKKSIISHYLSVLDESKILSTKHMEIISLRRQPYLIFNWIINLIFNLINLNNIVRKQRIDLIYGNNSYDIILATLYKVIFNDNIKFIAHVHDILSEKNLPSYFIKLFISKIDYIIVPSKAAEIALNKIVRNRSPIKVVYNGIKIDNLNNNISYSCISDSKKNIAFIAMISQIKRLDLFFDIIFQLAKIRNDFFVSIVGDFVDEKLEKSIKDKVMNYLVDIRFLGKIDHDKIYDVYNSIDYLIVTSDREALPTVIIEAMAFGKIVIARKVGGVEEIIEDGFNGFLFEYNDTPYEISKKINGIFDMLNEDKIKIARNAINSVSEKFNNELKKSIINEVIEKICVN